MCVIVCGMSESSKLRQWNTSSVRDGHWSASNNAIDKAVSQFDFLDCCGDTEPNVELIIKKEVDSESAEESVDISQDIQVEAEDALQKWHVFNYYKLSISSGYFD